MKVVLYEKRCEMGVTLAALSSLSGISKSTLNRIENEVTPPNLIQLEKIAEALGVHITDLFESDYK